MITRNTTEIGLDYGHTLPDHYSFCSQVHGHRGRIIAVVEGEVVSDDGRSDNGMVMDFGKVKELMMTEIHEKLDHGFAVWKDDTRLVDIMVNREVVSVSTLDFIKARNTKVLVTDTPPTAEYLAKWCFERLSAKLPEGIKLVSIQFYETPNHSSTYTL